MNPPGYLTIWGYYSSSKLRCATDKQRNLNYMASSGIISSEETSEQANCQLVHRFHRSHPGFPESVPSSSIRVMNFGSSSAFPHQSLSAFPFSSSVFPFPSAGYQTSYALKHRPKY